MGAAFPYLADGGLADPVRYLGYYLADDDWVIRKHAQMLTDAGVDVIIVDLTNAVM